MLLYRIAPEGSWAVAESASDPRLRLLKSDPFATSPGDWEYGDAVSRDGVSLLAPSRLRFRRGSGAGPRGYRTQGIGCAPGI